MIVQVSLRRAVPEETLYSPIGDCLDWNIAAAVAYHVMASRKLTASTDLTLQISRYSPRRMRLAFEDAATRQRAQLSRETSKAGLDVSQRQAARVIAIC
jgi:hypothetical protein